MNLPRYSFVVILLTCLLPLQASAQLLQPAYSAPSPQAASLGEFGAIPVSLFTGTPEISIPLFELEAGNFKYPIGVSYHLASVKPHLQPGTSGLGWMLSDACINRTVRGVYDEKMDDSGIAHGFYGHYAKMKNISNAQFDQYTQQNLTAWDNQTTWFELSADEFSFSVNGHSGLFYLNPDGGWTVVSDEDIVVEFDATSGFLGYQDLLPRFPKISQWSNRHANTRWFKKFTLVMPDGVRYEFGGVNAIDFSIPYYGRSTGDLVATAWHLTSITTPKGYVISFNYSADQILCDLHYDAGRTTAYGFPATTTSYLQHDIHGRSGLSGFLLFPAALTRVVGPAETIDITYLQDSTYNAAYRDIYPDALYWEDPDVRSENLYQYYSTTSWSDFFEMIPVSDNITGTTKQKQQAIASCFRHDLIQRISRTPRYNGLGNSWVFEYGGLYRKKLMSLACSAADSSSTSLPHWHFRYDTEELMPKGYFLPATDAWGTWKGGTTVLSSAYQPQVKQPAALSYAKAETLNEIHYPTGGKTVLDYERNTYGKYARANHSGVQEESGTTGGLRLKSLTHIDRAGTVLGATRYRYQVSLASQTSSGIATQLPPDSLAYIVSANQFVVAQSRSGFPASATNRNTPMVGYSSVIEETVDASGNAMGAIRYRFSNFDTDLFGTSHTDEPYIHGYNCGNAVVGVPYTSNSAERGRLQSKEWYNAQGALLRKETIRYARVCHDSLVVADQRMAILCSDPIFFTAAHLGWLTKTRTYSYLPVETEVTEYRNGIPVTQTTSTEYNSFRLPSRTSSSRSDNAQTVKQYSYSGNYPSQYGWLLSRHIVDAPVSVQTSVGQNGWEENLSYASVTNALGNQAPYISVATKGRTGSNNLKTIYETLSADNWANPTEVIADGLRTQLEWSYDGQRLLRVTDNTPPPTRNGRGPIPQPIDTTQWSPSTPGTDLDLDLDGPQGSLTRRYGYDTSLRLDYDAQPNGLVNRHTYDAIGRQEGLWETDQSDAWSSYRLIRYWRYQYPDFDVPTIQDRSSRSTERRGRDGSEPEEDDPIREIMLQRGKVSSATLEYRSYEYQQEHPSNVLAIFAPDTLNVNFRGLWFTYYNGGGGSSLPDEGTAALYLDLYNVGFQGDSLVCYLPLEVDCSTLTIRVASGYPSGGNYGYLRTLPPGQYRVEFHGIDPDAGYVEPDRGLRYEIPENYPAFTLLMECLPLDEDEEEPETPTINSWNSIRTGESRDGTAQNASLTVAWLDDLGREDISVAIGASPNGSHWISLRERDEWGREIKQWLPAVAGQSYSESKPAASTVRSLASTTYDGDAKPYNLTEYDPSPLGRVSGLFGPGAAWHNAGKKETVDYLTNTTSGAELICRKFVCTPDGSGTAWAVTSSGLYTAGTLYVKRTTDEDGKQVLVFEDFDGQTVLSREKLSQGQYLDTYYIFDVYGNLQAVLPPLASAAFSGNAVPQDALNNYAYLYTYDDRNRCIVKKLPGAQAVYYVYDNADRAILTQDGNARLTGKALFTLYDVFGREVLTGTCQNTITPGSQINSVVKASYTGSANSLKGYTIDGVSLSYPQILTAKWYDRYNFVGDVLGITQSANDTTLVYGTAAPNALSLQTGDWAASLGSKGATEPEGTWRILRYDRRNRLAKILSFNHLSDITIEDDEFTFRGALSRKRIVHSIGKPSSFYEDYIYTYDNEQRLLTETHSLNGGTATTLASNTYDALGRPLASTRADTPTLTSSYSYNVRSWITSVLSPLFAEKLYYNSARNNSNATPLWSGNISSIEWDLGPAYDFTYDGLGRLTGAAHSTESSCSRAYSYDAHGNITSQTIGGSSQSFSYSGNHLSTAQYDTNGNTTSSSADGITSVTYNVLNLPEAVVKTNGETVSYLYSASGAKLRETVTQPSPASGSVQTDYSGNLIYRDGLLGRILVDGGSIAAKDATLAPVYEFAFTDHLGSVRALAKAGEAVYRKTNYGPYGDILSEANTSELLPIGPGDEEEEGEEEDPGFRGRSLPSGIIQTLLDNPYRFGGKERVDAIGQTLYDFGARQYTTSLPRWLTMDPLAEKYYNLSPYLYCAGNPVNMVDRDGRNPVYDEHGAFLGVDNFGLQGSPIFLYKNQFALGMDHNEAMRLNSLWILQTYDKQTLARVFTHYIGLSQRPDWDGIVTINEGVKWAKTHLGAKEKPTPDNMLYIDTSKLNFGSVSLNNNTTTNIDLYCAANMIRSLYNQDIRNTTYALGRVKIQVIDNRIYIDTDKSTDYDWNQGGSFKRRVGIFLERVRAGVDDRHGFKVFYYGFGHINSASE